MPFAVALLRHPPIKLAAGTCYGRTDAPLAAGWESWAANMAARLAAGEPGCGWRRLWSSPSLRCASIAGTLAKRLHLEPALDERLMELDFGDWEGQSWTDVPRDALDRWAADPAGFKPPGGESGAALIDRAAGFGRMLLNEARPCIVLSHGGPLRLLRALLQGQTADLLARPPGLGSLEILRVVAPVRVQPPGPPG
jgi:alpha-ribazole phosphatase